jgi:hypothetical protein
MVSVHGYDNDGDYADDDGGNDFDTLMIMLYMLLLVMMRMFIMSKNYPNNIKINVQCPVSVIQ